MPRAIAAALDDRCHACGVITKDVTGCHWTDAEACPVMTAARAELAKLEAAIAAADELVEYLDGFTHGNPHAEDSRKAIAAYRAARGVCEKVGA